MPIPPDTRSAGDTGHITDHNQISDELTTLAAGVAASLPLAGGTMSGAIAMGSHKVTGLARTGPASTDFADLRADPRRGPTVAIANGGTGQTTAAGAIAALGGVQAANGGKETVSTNSTASGAETLNLATGTSSTSR